MKDIVPGVVYIGEVPSDLWRIGDVVTRDGTDEHEIVNIYEDMIDVVCIKEPSSPWTRLGEEEGNLTRRYSFVRAGLNANPVEKMGQIRG